MFMQGTPAEVDAQVRKLALGQSILDAVADQAKDLQRSVERRDRDRLDQYFTSVRELEQRMEMSQGLGTQAQAQRHRQLPARPRQPEANTWKRSS